MARRVLNIDRPKPAPAPVARFFIGFRSGTANAYDPISGEPANDRPNQRLGVFVAIDDRDENRARLYLVTSETARRHCPTLWACVEQECGGDRGRAGALLDYLSGRSGDNPAEKYVLCPVEIVEAGCPVEYVTLEEMEQDDPADEDD